MALYKKIASIIAAFAAIKSGVDARSSTQISFEPIAGYPLRNGTFLPNPSEINNTTLSVTSGCAGNSNESGVYTDTFDWQHGQLNHTGLHILANATANGSALFPQMNWDPHAPQPQGLASWIFQLTEQINKSLQPVLQKLEPTFTSISEQLQLVLHRIGPHFASTKEKTFNIPTPHINIQECGQVPRNSSANKTLVYLTSHDINASGKNIVASFVINAFVAGTNSSSCHTSEIWLASFNKTTLATQYQHRVAHAYSTTGIEFSNALAFELLHEQALSLFFKNDFSTKVSKSQLIFEIRDENGHMTIIQGQMFSGQIFKFAAYYDKESNEISIVCIEEHTEINPTKDMLAFKTAHDGRTLKTPRTIVPLDPEGEIDDLSIHSVTSTTPTSTALHSGEKLVSWTSKKIDPKTLEIIESSSMLQALDLALDPMGPSTKIAPPKNCKTIATRMHLSSTGDILLGLSHNYNNNTGTVSSNNLKATLEIFRPIRHEIPTTGTTAAVTTNAATATSGKELTSAQSTTDDAGNSNSSSEIGLSTGQIIGLTVAGLMVLAVILISMTPIARRYLNRLLLPNDSSSTELRPMP